MIVPVSVEVTTSNLPDTELTVSPGATTSCCGMPPTIVKSPLATAIVPLPTGSSSPATPSTATLSLVLTSLSRLATLVIVPSSSKVIAIGFFEMSVLIEKSNLVSPI